jgi:hypothetical protein
LVVASVDGDSIMGTFYRSAVRNATFNGPWGPLHAAFTTSDGTNAYHHHAVLLAPRRLEGTTHAPGRDFPWVWRVVRTSHEPPAASAGPRR